MIKMLKILPRESSRVLDGKGTPTTRHLPFVVGFLMRYTMNPYFSLSLSFFVGIVLGLQGLLNGWRGKMTYICPSPLTLTIFFPSSSQLLHGSRHSNLPLVRHHVLKKSHQNQYPPTPTQSLPQSGHCNHPNANLQIHLGKHHV